MGILSLIGSFFGMIGSGVQGYFQGQAARTQLMNSAVSVLGNELSTEAQKQQAVMNLYIADSQSSSVLTRNWRPLVLLGCLSLVLSWWFFGVTPAHFNDPVTPMMGEILDMMKWLMGIGIGTHGAENIIASIVKSNVVRGFLK